MLGLVPRKVQRQSLETALHSMGYRTRRETFEVHGYRELRGQRRFHAKVETFGEDMVPKAAQIDLHIDQLNGDALGRHGYQVDGEVIQDELDRILQMILATPATGTNRTTCPDCGKELFADHLENHLKIEHPRRGSGSPSLGR
jgi:hypothetical protein